MINCDILTRREIEARIVAPLLEAFAAEIGNERALEIVQTVILQIARQQGEQLAQQMGGCSLVHFAAAQEAWKKGDADGLARALLEPMRTDEYQALFDSIFLQRNRRMSEAVKGYLSISETRFVVVGSGHLVGPGGVVDLLNRAGYTVQQR